MCWIQSGNRREKISHNIVFFVCVSSEPDYLSSEKNWANKTCYLFCPTLCWPKVDLSCGHILWASSSNFDTLHFRLYTVTFCYTPSGKVFKCEVWYLFLRGGRSMRIRPFYCNSQTQTSMGGLYVDLPNIRDLAENFE